MKDDLDFKSWDVPELSDEKMQELYGKAMSRAAKRQTNRRIAYSAMATIIVVLGIVVYFHLRQPSLESEFLQLQSLLEKEVRRNEAPFRTVERREARRETMEVLYDERI